MDFNNANIINNFPMFYLLCLILTKFLWVGIIKYITF